MSTDGVIDLHFFSILAGWRFILTWDDEVVPRWVLVLREPVAGS
jgi:hypothetical protein